MCGQTFELAVPPVRSLTWRHVSLLRFTEEQSKPRSWHVVLVAETQTGESPESNAALDEACCNLLFAPLSKLHESSLPGVNVCWDSKQQALERTVLLPQVHSLLMDDPQQHTTLNVSGCAYCDQPNSIRSSASFRKSNRTEAIMGPIIDTGLQVIEDNLSTRSKEYRVAKAHTLYHGLSWPPRHPPTSDPMLTASGTYWVSGFMALHNIGLCLIPDTVQLCVQLIFLLACKESTSAFKRGVERSLLYVRSQFEGCSLLKGRCKTRGLAGILVRFEPGKTKTGAPKLPRIRRSSRYDLSNLLRFFRLLVHETLMEYCPVAAKALLRLLEFSRIAHAPSGLVDSERGELRSTAIELASLIQTAANIGDMRFKDGRLKDLNGSNNHHKSLRHTAELYDWLGPFTGAASDNHGELMQKLMHMAYRNFSSKQLSKGDLLKQVAQWLTRYEAVKHGERTVALSHADFVTAARLGLQPILRQLLNHTLIDLFATDEASGRVPVNDALIAAAEGAHTRCVRLLLEVRADQNAQRGHDGQTPLIMAARAGSKELLGELLGQNDQSVSIIKPRLDQTWRKLNAIQWAEHEGHTAAASQLRASSQMLPPSPRRTPATAVDRSRHRLCPTSRAQQQTMRWLDLTRLRTHKRGSDAQERTWRQGLKELSQHLEFALRV